jgi:hypothetical protein
MALKAGWGRIHVKRIPAEKALHIGKYLTKEDRASTPNGKEYHQLTPDGSTP